MPIVLDDPQFPAVGVPRIVQTVNDKSGEKTLRASVTPGNARKARSQLRLRLLGDDFAILPDVDRRAVHGGITAAASIPLSLSRRMPF